MDNNTISPIRKIENTIHLLVTNLDEASFIYDLLLAYDQPKSSITRLKKGDYNLSKIPGEILWKKKLFFKNKIKNSLQSLKKEGVINITGKTWRMSKGK